MLLRFVCGMNIHPLTPIEFRIVEEVCRFLAQRSDGSKAFQDAISILGSWGDSMPEEQILTLLSAINESGPGWEAIRKPDPGLEVLVDEEVRLHFRTPSGEEAYVRVDDIVPALPEDQQHAVVDWADELLHRHEQRNSEKS